jgi:endonuclease-3
MAVTKKIKEEMLERFNTTYGILQPALHYASPFELMVAVVLSAQCTDERVNIVTKELFPQYNTPDKLATLGLVGLEEKIKTCGLYHSKAKNLLAACAMLCEQYHGEVPATFDDLVKLPGVGRKTANVLVSILFDTPAIAVDTHVFRVANRTGLGPGKTPLEVEMKLQKAIPKEWWSRAHHWLIWHGRRVCKSRNPLCSQCFLSDLCPYGKKSGKTIKSV